MITARQPSSRTALVFLAACAAASLLVTCTSGCAPPAGAWHQADTLAQFTFATEVSVDYLQTADFVAPRCLESNPIVGRCGQRVPVDLYLFGALATEFGAAWLMPPRWRGVFEGILVGVEGLVIYDNARGGAWPSGQ